MSTIFLLVKGTNSGSSLRPCAMERKSGLHGESGKDTSEETSHCGDWPSGVTVHDGTEIRAARRISPSSWARLRRVRRDQETSHCGDWSSCVTPKKSQSKTARDKVLEKHEHQNRSKQHQACLEERRSFVSRHCFNWSHAGITGQYWLRPLTRTLPRQQKDNNRDDEPQLTGPLCCPH